MTYQEIVKQAQDGFLSADTTGFDGNFAIQVDIIGEGEGSFYIAYKNNTLSVEPYEYIDRDAKLIASADTFLKIADGSLNAIAAFTVGKLKVEGSIDKSLEVQKRIEIMLKNKKKSNKKK